MLDSENSRPPATLSLAEARQKTHEGLIVKARFGDATAFTELMRQFHVRVFRFALKWVKNPDDAQDITQEVFLVAWRTIGNFRGDAAFSTWLLGIALNLARNHVQRGPGRHEVELPEDEELLGIQHFSQTGDPARLVDAKEQLLRLDKAIRALPMELRETLTLVRIEGLSMEEAAHLLQIPTGTIKSRLHRAKELLLGQIGDIS